MPGCGKSLSAKAVSARWELPLYRLDMASILGMWVGQSETRLRNALELADRVAPCVLWIDEIEKGLSSNRESNGGTTTRMIGQFLFWLQESTAGAFVVATANNVSTLPPELMRQGRFDAMFFVDLPDAEERGEIARLYLRRYLKIAEPGGKLLADLVRLSDGFSGAEIDAAIKRLAERRRLGQLAAITREDYQDTFAFAPPFSRSHPEALAELRTMRDRTVPASKRRGGAGPVY